MRRALVIIVDDAIDGPPTDLTLAKLDYIGRCATDVIGGDPSTVKVVLLPEAIGRATHSKTGGEYVVLSETAIAQASNGPIRDDATITVYLNDDGKLFARAAGEFRDPGRFNVV